MKTATSILLSLLFTVPAFSDDQTLERSKTATEANRDAQRKLEAQRREQERQAKAMLEGKPIVFGGFIVDVAHAEKKTRLLSLRQPANAKADAEHVYLDERTGRPKGFVLFSLGF